MAVAFDAKSSAVVNVSGVATLTLSNITVGSNPNTALFFLIEWVSGTNPTVSACNWDDAGTPQAMTLVAGTQGAAGGPSAAVAIYRLVAPTPGTKNLKISWTGNLEAHAVAVSFSGVDQVTPTRNGATNFKSPAAASPATITIASAVGNQVLAGFEQQVAVWPTTACSGNEIAQQDAGPAQGTAYSYTSGAASVSPTASWTGGSTDVWVAWGCDVQAASGGAAVPSLGWQSPLSAATRAIQAASSFSFVPFDTVQPSNSLPMQGWQQPLSAARQPVTLTPPFSFVPLNPAQPAAVALATGWQSPFSIAPQRASVPYSQPQLVPPPNPQIPFGWQLQLSVAPPIVRSPFGFSFVPLDTAQAQTPTTPPVWLSPLSIAPPIVKAPPGFAYVPFDTPQVVAQGASLGWQSALSAAPPAARAPQSYSYVPFDTAQITTQVISLAWQQPLSIAAPRPAAAPQSLAFVPFNTAQVQPAGISGMAWFNPLGLAPPRLSPPRSQPPTLPMLITFTPPPPDTGRPHNLPFMVTVGRFRSF